jgi:aspartate/glutamate racemase
LNDPGRQSKGEDIGHGNTVRYANTFDKVFDRIPDAIKIPLRNIPL